MSWRFDREVLGPGTLRLTAAVGSEPLRFADIVRGWQVNPEVSDAWTSALADLPFEAVAWECPALTDETLWDRFECVVHDHSGLVGVQPEPEVFAAHLASAVDRIAAFANLGGDSRLIAPVAGGDFAHLLAFCRKADAALARALWRRVGLELEGRLGPRPVWLSTEGSGVHWLHVRLDPRPKYYRHGPYRRG